MHRVLPIAVLTVLIAASCAPDSPPAPTAPPAAPPAAAKASDFESTIARLEALDPGSPETLNARLEYADFLSSAEGPDCGKRLDAAQAQLDSLGNTPAFLILLPLAHAKLHGGAYKIRAARAECDPSRRGPELQSALEEARDAAILYQDGLDYQSAVIMRFNVAATLHALGEDAQATEALEATIAMDRDYGFRDDAEDNVRLLQHWRGEDESDARIAELMKDFPAREQDFKFKWWFGDADVAIDASESSLAAGRLVQSHGTIALKRHVRLSGGVWDVSYEAGIPIVDLGIWPPDNEILQRFTAYLLTSALLRTPKFDVDRNGDFEVVRDARDFGQALGAAISARLGEAPPAEGTASGPLQALAQNLKLVFSAQNVQVKAAETYNLETATWAGAKLEQGVWYQMSASMFLPGLGMGQFMIDHDIEFSFTRMVACAPDDKETACAEIVVHITPDPKDLKLATTQVSHGFHLTDAQALHYWSTTDIRLVMRPETLVPYVSDWRRSWYVAIPGSGKDNRIVSSERVVTVSTYH